MRLMLARSPELFFGVAESFEGVEDMLLAASDGPSDVLSVNLETCAG